MTTEMRATKASTVNHPTARCAFVQFSSRPCTTIKQSGMQLLQGQPRRRIAAAAAGENPLRTAIAGAVQNVYKATAAFQPVEAGLSPLWAGVKKLNVGDVSAALRNGGDANERNADGDTPLLYIARQGHYKYPPSEIPQALLKGGADLNAKDNKGLTALQVSLLAGWQNIAELLIKSNASTQGVSDIKSRLTCPDCKRIVAQYNL